MGADISKQGKKQKINKLADFHFKLLHRLDPSMPRKPLPMENCRNKQVQFGCNSSENYNHMFITCPRLTSFPRFIENILQLLGFSFRLTMRILFLGTRLVILNVQISTPLFLMLFMLFINTG